MGYGPRMGMQDHFDQIADTELRWLESKLGEFDPDELEVELSQGVLTLTLGDDSKIVVNSHHAAGEIWMAAFRQAWHFAPKEEGGKVEWRTQKDELRTTLGRILSDKLGRAVQL
jgi:iron-sulfur cluster assembly protein CyaY